MRADDTASSGPPAPLALIARAPEELGLEDGALAALLAETGPLAIVDLETTGLAGEPGAEILEFGALLLDPGRREITSAECLVRPAGPLPLAVQRLTGLSDGDVSEAPAIEEVAGGIARALAGRAIVAHNAEFERHFLARFVSPELDKARYLDTQDLLAVSHPDAPDLRLETFARELLGSEERHRGLSDALDTARVMARVAAGSRAGEPRYATARSALDRYAPESPWRALLAAPLGAPAPALAREFVEIRPGQEEPVPFDPDAIAAALSDEPRGRRHLPGYRVRGQQIEMARAFARVLADGGLLLLEGGTGVGKSLAYLAAAIPFAMERAAGGIREPVVISTRTKLLQDQLLGKDIPAAAALLGYPELRALSIKGRANYVCARRLEQVLAEGNEGSIFPEDRLAYAVLAACARTRPHGEIGALPGAMLFRFPALRDLLRRSVAARAEQCTREQCALERACPFGRQRAALAQAQLVVANHDLLLRWPPDYPTFSCAIVDEAHELAGVADEVYALEVAPELVIERLDELFGRPARPGAGARGGALLSRGHLRALERDARAWRRGVQQDLVALGRSLAHRASEYGEVQLPAEAERLFPEAAELARTAAARLEQVADAAAELAPGEGFALAEAVERTLADLRAAAEGLRGAFAGGQQDAVAAFERLDPPYDRWRLVVRPVAPAAAFHERFAARLESLSCVSASLFVGGDAFASLGELELEERSELPLVRLAVESPFPYRDHMRVVALRGGGDLVEETAEVLAELARRLGGRTLGLFTSLRRMHQVAELLSLRLRGEGFDVLAPRRAHDDPAALVERFQRAGGGGVLLGARSFWQGLDIPGPALSAVVIEKLPFEVPTELRKRRAARLREAGQNDFERYSLGKMLLYLKQMAGRLIRSEDDRGIVAIVEGRTERRYFERLRDALPPGCPLEVARREDLGRYLEEVGIGEAAGGWASIGRGPGRSES